MQEKKALSSRGSKITADGDFSHEIKRYLLLGRKVMANLDSILNSRDIALPTKVHLLIAVVFPVVLHGCESWTIKKAEHQRIDALQVDSSPSEPLGKTEPGQFLVNDVWGPLNMEIIGKIAVLENQVCVCVCVCVCV